MNYLLHLQVANFQLLFFFDLFQDYNKCPQFFKIYSDSHADL